MKNTGLLALMGDKYVESNESLETVELTPSEAIAVGADMANQEAYIASSFESYDMLTVATKEMGALSAELSNESEAIVSSTETGINAVVNVVGLSGIVVASPESIESFKKDAAKSLEVLLNNIAIAIKKWAASAATSIMAIMNDNAKLVSKAGGIKGGTEIEITPAVIKAAAGLRSPDTFIGGYLEGKADSVVTKAVDKLTFNTNDFAKLIDSVTTVNVNTLLNAESKVKRAAITHLGSGQYGVLGWKVKGEDSKSNMVYFKTTAKKTVTLSAGTGKFSDLKIDLKDVVSSIEGLSSIKALIATNSSKIEAVSKHAKAAIEKAGDDKAEVNQVKSNMLAVTKFLSDAAIGKLTIYHNAVTIVKAVKA